MNIHSQQHEINEIFFVMGYFDTLMIVPCRFLQDNNSYRNDQLKRISNLKHYNVLSNNKYFHFSYDCTTTELLMFFVMWFYSLFWVCININDSVEKTN